LKDLVKKIASFNLVLVGSDTIQIPQISGTRKLKYLHVTLLSDM